MNLPFNFFFSHNMGRIHDNFLSLSYPQVNINADADADAAELQLQKNLENWKKITVLSNSKQKSIYSHIYWF